MDVNVKEGEEDEGCTHLNIKAVGVWRNKEVVACDDGGRHVTLLV